MIRVIFHIDMNSYFASCEQQANRLLRGRPVGVCEHLGGIIIAPSVEAKRLGIKTGTPTRKAKRVCPDIVLLPADPPKYRSITQKFLKIFAEYASQLERYSIDEAFLDVTPWLESVRQRTDDSRGDGRGIWRDALMLALEIKARIRREVGEWLTCSVGAAPNKLVAKIASDLDKPDGVTVVQPDQIESLRDRLQLTDVPGIAERTARRLRDIGVFNLCDLAACPLSVLRAQFGILGHWLKDAGRLQGSETLVTPEQETVKSVGHAYTLPRATGDAAEIHGLLRKLSEKVALRLRRQGLQGREVSCHVRFADHTGDASRSHRMREHTDDGRIIFEQAKLMLAEISLGRPVRMAGVSISDLASCAGAQPIFKQYTRRGQVLAAIDEVNGKHGEFTIQPATLLLVGDIAGDTIGFGRIKELPKPAPT